MIGAAMGRDTKATSGSSFGTENPIVDVLPDDCSQVSAPKGGLPSVGLDSRQRSGGMAGEVSRVH